MPNKIPSEECPMTNKIRNIHKMPVPKEYNLLMMVVEVRTMVHVFSVDQYYQSMRLCIAMKLSCCAVLCSSSCAGVGSTSGEDSNRPRPA